jgi:23S rRNA (guanosine2251-2'-O)-methyltransferase
VRNLGSIARTAEVLGAHGMILPADGRTRINADAVRTSAGALFHLPVARTHQLEGTLDYLQSSGIQLVALWEDGEFMAWHADLTGPTCLLLGAEDVGIPRRILNRCDTTLRIPIMGQTASLNVGVATGAVLYEAVRQRNSSFD